MCDGVGPVEMIADREDDVTRFTLDPHDIYGVALLY